MENSAINHSFGHLPAHHDIEHIQLGLKILLVEEDSVEDKRKHEEHEGSKISM